MKKKVVENFNRGLFWDVKQDALSFKKSKRYIVHRVLSYGGMDDVRTLIKVYGRTGVKQEFLKPDPGVYEPSILRLCQHLLGVKKLNPRFYVKDLRAPAIRPYYQS